LDQADSVNEQSYSYDQLNRLKSVTEQRMTAAGGWVWQAQFGQVYDYDRYGNRTIAGAPETWGTGINNKQFAVNVATNRLAVPTGYSGVMTYDAAGNLVNDTYTGFGQRVYDADNKMTAAQDGYGGWSYYSYDANGQRTRRKNNNQETWQIYGMDGELLAEYAANAAASNPQKEYGYRNGQLLITATPAQAPGLNVASAANGAVATASSTVSTYVASNAINGDHVGTGSWWADGTSNIWDDWIQVDFAGLKTISEIHVYGLQQNPSSPIEPTPTMTSSYALTDFRVEYWTSGGWVTVPGASVIGNNKVWNKFTFAPLTTSKIRVYVTRVVGDNRSQVVEVKAYTPTEGSIQWLVTDHLGTPRLIVDQTGAWSSVKRHDYLPFGEELFAGTGGRSTTQGYSAADGIRQQFTQKERDIETGLDYFEARYFSSTQGRFTTVDPVTFAASRKYEPQAINLYSYCGNNPLTRIDPDGRYYVGKDGRKVKVSIDRKGDVQVGSNRNESLQRYADLVNKYGNSEAISAMLKVATNATKVHFQISNEVKRGKDNSLLFGLHQAHDKNGKVLEWNDETKRFDGDAAFVKGRGGKTEYKEVTITIYEGSIKADWSSFFARRYDDPNITVAEIIVTVGVHEKTHDTDNDSIQAVKDRQEGRNNTMDVEIPAMAVEIKAADEIRKKRNPKP
jgi:RHS repeat-associated protein